MSLPHSRLPIEQARLYAKQSSDLLMLHIRAKYIEYLETSYFILWNHQAMP